MLSLLPLLTMVAGPCPVPQLCQRHFRTKYLHSWQVFVQLALPGIERGWGAPELGRGEHGVSVTGENFSLSLWGWLICGPAVLAHRTLGMSLKKSWKESTG